MKNRKRILASILFLALLASCNNGGTAPLDTTPPNDVSDTESLIETKNETKTITAASILGGRDYTGAEYHILGREYGKLGSLPAMEFAVEEENGDIINDTIFRRNNIVEELLNVKITAEQCPGDKWSVDLVNASQQAGDGTYDLIWQHVNDMKTMFQMGLLFDYNEMPDINIAKPWWNQLATKSLTINGRCYLQMNYIPFTGVLLSHCLYFNKTIVEDQQMEDIYSLVLNNKWDFDTFSALTRQVSMDVDGNGVYDENDTYGLICSHGTSGIAFSVAMGTKPVEVHDDGSFTLTMSTEKNQNILEKIVALTSDNATYLITDYSLENDLAKMFVNGKSLFYSGFLTDSYQFFRDMEDDFGLIPFPKYDTAQEKYITTVTGGTGLLGIPKYLADREKTGAVTEALAIESLSRIYPVIAETVFNTKVLRDSESAKMFDIIMDGMEIDFGRTFKYGAYSDLIADLVAAASTDLVSTATAQESAAREHYQSIIDLYFQSEE